jgi:peptide deformylase
VSLLDVHVLGDPILRQGTTPVAAVTDAIRRLVDDMFETMYAAKGIGLAAPQVGRLERVAVIDVGEREPFAIINPEIVLAEGSVKGEEGCLSIPEVYGDVERASRVVVRAIGRDGEPMEIDATELMARCLQHEIDHLHGKLFIDYLGAFKRRAALAKWAKEREKYPGNVRKLSPAEVASHHQRDEEL